MNDMRSKLDLLYQEVLGEVADIVQRVEALQAGIPQATAALEAAASAAGEVKSAAEQVPAVILQQTAAAGSDLRGQVETAGKAIVEAAEQKAVQAAALGAAAIDKSVEAGRGVLKQAVNDLAVAAREKRDALVQDMQAAALRAVERQVQEGLAARVARSYTIVVASLLFAAIAGGAVALVGARVSGHLTPWRDKIATTSEGAPFCGPIGPGTNVAWSCLLTR